MQRILTDAQQPRRSNANGDPYEPHTQLRLFKSKLVLHHLEEDNTFFLAWWVRTVPEDKPRGVNLLLIATNGTLLSLEDDTSKRKQRTTRLNKQTEEDASQGDDQQRQRQRQQMAVNKETTTMETPSSLQGRCSSANSYNHAADVYKDDALCAEDQNRTIDFNSLICLAKIC